MPKITVAQARDLTRVQRLAVAAITGSWMEDYGAACQRLGIEADLSLRRLSLCNVRHLHSGQLQTPGIRTSSPGWKIHPTPGEEGRPGGSRNASQGDISSLPALTSLDCSMASSSSAFVYLDYWGCNTLDVSWDFT